MSVKIVMLPSRPGSIEFTMALTMTLDEWERLAAQCMDAYPAWHLAGAIQDAALKARTEITTQVEVGP